MGGFGGPLLCSNCGFENPSGHRYCGMCGTPFPYRALTVPSAQSTLSFTSTPVEVAPRGTTIEEPVAAPAPEPNAAMRVSAETEPVEQWEFLTEAGPVYEPALGPDAAFAPVQEPGHHETFADVPQAPASMA